MKMSQYFVIYGACTLISISSASIQGPCKINHEGYKSTTMEEQGLSPSFSVFECRRTDGCSLIDAAAAKAAFAAEHYARAAESFLLAAGVYCNAEYPEVAARYQSAADICLTANQAFLYLSQFDEAHFSELNIRGYHELREELANKIDPIYLDACKLCAEAFIASASIHLDTDAVHTAAAYHDSAAAAAFRAYQFYYAGLDDASAAGASDEGFSLIFSHGITALASMLVAFVSSYCLSF